MRSDARRGAERKYNKSAKGKARTKRYQATEKYKVCRSQYDLTDNGKATYARYVASEKGKARDRHYATTPKGCAAKKKAGAQRRAHKQLGRVSAEDWARILRYFQNRCAYCGASLATPSQDHVTPLSTGGQHHYANVVPACRSCNSRKGAHSLEVFLAKTGCDLFAVCD